MFLRRFKNLLQINSCFISLGNETELIYTDFKNYEFIGEINIFISVFFNFIHLLFFIVQ